MRKEKAIKGVKVKFKGKEIKNVTGFYYDSYEGKFFINYKENENTYININCEPKDIEIVKE